MFFDIKDIEPRSQMCKVCYARSKRARQKLHIGKVADEPDEWVLGELVEIENSQYPYIFQKQEFPWTKCCGVGTFAVEKDSIKEVII
jgi:hypothetical protein